MEGADSPPVTPDGRGRNERGLLTPARAVLHSEIRGVPALPVMATAADAEQGAPPQPPGHANGPLRRRGRPLQPSLLHLADVQALIFTSPRNNSLIRP